MRKKTVWRKKGVRWKLVFGVVGVLAVVVVAGTAVTALLSGSKLRVALEMVLLADVPDGASQLRFEGSGDARSSTYFIKFAAPAEQIEEFIANSPSLRRLTAETLGPDHMCLPRSARRGDADDAGNHVYFERDGRYPWFDPTIRVQGRRYVIPRDQDANQGEVIIDDENNVVYIRVCRG